MHDIDSALRVIRERDARAAILAQGMWHLMRNGTGHPRVTRYDVQKLLWEAVPYALRKPETLKELPDRHAVSATLAELLDLMGYPRYATLCRSQVTRHILDAAEDERRCADLVADAWRESGIDPPDTPIVTWTRLRGPVEEALHGATGRALEEAIDIGTVKLGTPNAENVRIELTVRVLSLPYDDTEDSWFARLLNERLDTWIPGGGSQTRREMVARLRPEVYYTPDETGAGLPGLQRLLDACRDGARLTARGYLPTALVRELAEIMPSCTESGRTGRTESVLPPVRLLRKTATQFGFLRSSGGRLWLTSVGHQVVDDSDLLLMCVGEQVVTFALAPLGLLQEVMLAALLLEKMVAAERLVEKVARAFEEEGWADQTGQPFGPDQAAVAASLYTHQLRVLDVARVHGDRVDLTEAGRSVARWALRARVMLRQVSG